MAISWGRQRIGFSTEIETARMEPTRIPLLASPEDWLLEEGCDNLLRLWGKTAVFGNAPIKVYAGEWISLCEHKANAVIASGAESFQRCSNICPGRWIICP